MNALSKTVIIAALVGSFVGYGVTSMHNSLIPEAHAANGKCVFTLGQGVSSAEKKVEELNAGGYRIVGYSAVKEDDKAPYHYFVACR